MMEPRPYKNCEPHFLSLLFSIDFKVVTRLDALSLLGRQTKRRPAPSASEQEERWAGWYAFSRKVTLPQSVLFFSHFQRNYVLR